jgi:NhaP-type Na+/H+ or K+/H+ antiporter
VEWALASVAVALLAYAAVSGRLAGTSLTAPMVFTAFGLLVGTETLGFIDLSPLSDDVQTLAEATLAVVLFSDASRIDLGALRRTVGVPVRLLGIGLPLTIALGAAAAAVLFGAMTFWEAVILAVVLAPTDAALGQAVVTEPRVPQRIRQGLNVESGLNDGICVPLLFAAVAAADVQSEISGGRSPATLLLEEIGYGILGGVAAGLLVAAIIREAGKRDLITGPWRQVVPAAGAALAYGIASALDGSGFIAAFVAGMVFRLALGRDPEEVNRLTEEVGSVLNGITFVLFGAVLLGPALADATWQLVLYATLSLTIVRMAPVAIAMWGTRARSPTIGFLGWFGPRGLASIVFAVIVIEESALPHEALIVRAIYTTVGLSVLAHGITASPLANRYARWYERHPHEQRPPMESAPADAVRPRGPVTRTTGTPAADQHATGTMRKLPQPVGHAPASAAHER